MGRRHDSKPSRTATVPSTTSSTPSPRQGVHRRRRRCRHDAQGRIRLDGWELDPAVQTRVQRLWTDPEAVISADPAGPAWFYGQFRELYGWDVAGVDYDRDVETSVPWPTR